MINWFNCNQGFMSAILSFISLFVSVIAIWISIKSTNKQNRIELFDKKYDIYKSLENYFESLKGNPKAILHFLHPGMKFENDNPWRPEINEIAGKASLLFSDSLSQNLKDMEMKYSRMRQLDNSISSYFSYLEEEPISSEVIPLYKEYFSNNSPTDEDEKKFKQTCEKSIIKREEQTDYNNFEYVTYNLYDLYNEQSNIHTDICNFQKKILKGILEEIKPL